MTAADWKEPNDVASGKQKKKEIGTKIRKMIADFSSKISRL